MIKKERIAGLIQFRAEQMPDAIAIAAPGRAPLRYGGLLGAVQQVIAVLNAAGIGRNDRVAIVLPNGPELAVTFLAVACGATSAPLNPAYQTQEFEFYLSDLNAKALIVLSGSASPSRAVARSLGIPIIELMPINQKPAGIFTLAAEHPLEPVGSTFAEPDDIALVLHTSGTTSRPKIVPLSQINLCTTARNIESTLRLTHHDRCLNVMPLFHIHGLMAAVLSSIKAGGSIVCTPGFSAAGFFEWMDDFRPTWYTAVPTMHQAVLERAPYHREIIERCPLRFIRSSSSSLPPQVMKALEETFDAPVIESYGMTEAAHQMASNPLPPGERKPGSVGLAAGPEVAIMDEAGVLLAPNAIGEIVIRGANVTLGYENNPKANERAFTNGWFRTGDQGYLDAGNYLYITGRLKEIINRGGEKIAPREVDEVILGHPAVAQVVTFAMAHPKLGEDVVAAVVPEPGTSVSERELRELAFAQLADFKVPSKILIVDEIPKGPTGKLQRIGLAEKLGDRLRPSYVRPESKTEVVLAEIWSSILGMEQIGIHDNFFALGGESLMAAQVIAEIRTAFHVELPLRRLFEYPVLGELAAHIDAKRHRNDAEESDEEATWSTMLSIQSGGGKRPFFMVPGGKGGETEFMIYAKLFYLLGRDQPIYGFRLRGLNGKQPPHLTVEAMAKDYIREIRTLQPEGPYLIGGECIGGVVAYEMAQQLRDQGQEVRLLVLINTRRPDKEKALNRMTRKVSRVLHLNNMSYHWWRLSQMGARERLGYLSGIVRGAVDILFSNVGTDDHERHIQQVQRAYSSTVNRYRPQSYDGPMALFVSSDYYARQPSLGWDELAKGPLQLYRLAGNRHSFLRDDVRGIAGQLKSCLDTAEQEFA